MPEPVTSSAVEQTPAAAATPPASGQPAATGQPGAASQPSVFAIPDDAIVEVADGTRLPWKEARGGYLRTADYTRKTQEVSELRKSLETERATIRERDEAYRELISKPEHALELYQHLLAEANKAQDKGEIPQNVNVQELVAKEVQKELQKAEDSRFVSDVESVTTRTINRIFEENPRIKSIPGSAAWIRAVAREAKPASLEELESALKDAGRRVTESLKAESLEIAKESAAERAKLTTQGVERPGGSAPSTTEAPSFLKGRNVDWSELDRQALASLDR